MILRLAVHIEGWNEKLIFSFSQKAKIKQKWANFWKIREIKFFFLWKFSRKFSFSQKFSRNFFSRKYEN
jgi:hypothetical protein